MSERGLSISEFRHRLGTWFEGAARELPWRGQNDPYTTWISEVLLQQTRVDQAIPYYRRFMAAFPSVQDLAAANLDEVLLEWEGLGYYSRARNLHRAAKWIVRDNGGLLPSSYDGLRQMPGVGDYTASAIGSLSFGLPEAVLDGNVIRVLARYDTLPDDVGRSPVRRLLRARAQELLDPDRPGPHNEAIMELGATICTPRSPVCGACPVAAGCLAKRSGSQDRYPVKQPKKRPPLVRVAVGVIARGDGCMLIQRRAPKGLLGGLWEFPGGKCLENETPRDACIREVREELGIEVRVTRQLAIIKHAYSHFRIQMSAFECDWIGGEVRARQGQPFRWVSPEKMGEFAFPRANRRLIELLEGGERTR